MLTYLSTKINGGQFRPAEARELLARCEPGHILLLKREPTNRFDSSAIQVLCLRDADWTPVSYQHHGDSIEDALDSLAEDGIFAEHVGYIPKDINPPIALAMDEGGAEGIARLSIGNLIDVQFGSVDELDDDDWPTGEDEE